MDAVGSKSKDGGRMIKMQTDFFTDIIQMCVSSLHSKQKMQRKGGADISAQTDTQDFVTRLSRLLTF